jgi:hypothetical protein
MEAVPDESQDGMVLKELQPGYMLKGSLLRVARVVVGRYGAEATDGEATELSEATTADRIPMASPAPPTPNAPSEGDDSSSTWEADKSGHELEFSDDGFDFGDE